MPEDALGSATISIVTVLVTALLAYLAASANWRRQERRKVYAEFVNVAGHFIQLLNEYERRVATSAILDNDQAVLRQASDAVVAKEREVALIARTDLRVRAEEITEETRVITTPRWLTNPDLHSQRRQERFGPWWEDLDEFIRRARRDIGADHLWTNWWGLALLWYRQSRLRTTISRLPRRASQEKH